MSSSRDARAARRNNATSSSAASDQNPVARYTQPVTYKCKKLPLWSGLVHGECGKLPFVHPSEGIHEDIGRVMNKQPAFTHPRTDWSHHNEDHPIRLSSEDKEHELNQKLEDVKHPYYNSSITPVSWTLHATDMWTVFKCITLKNYLYGDGVIALLRTATYGLENVITVAPYQLEILGSSIKANNKWGAQQTPFLPDTYWKVNCRAHLGFTSSLQARRQLNGIRFLIGCIRHEDYMHWTSFIWDSKMGKFYHFDSYLFDQKVRLSNAILGFREFLAGIGLPFTFTYYQMPISGQPSGWECGLIAAYCVIRTIRGLIGANYAEAVAIHGKMSLLLDNIPHEDAEPSDLLLSDWVLGLDDPGVASRTKISRSLEFIKAFFQQLILMELGVADGQYIQHFNDGTSRLTQIRNHDLISFRRMDTAPDSIEISELYTSEGGYLPIWSSQVTYIPRYTQHRIIPIPNSPQATLHRHFLSWHSARPDINFPIHGDVIRALGARGVDFEHGVPIRRLGYGGSISLLDDDEKSASNNAQRVTKEQETSLPSDQMVLTSPVQSSGREKTPVTQLGQLALITPKGPAATRPSHTNNKRSSTSTSSLSSIESLGTPPDIGALLKLAKGRSRAGISQSNSDTSMRSGSSLGSKGPGNLPRSTSDVSMKSGGLSNSYSDVSMRSGSMPSVGSRTSLRVGKTQRQGADSDYAPSSQGSSREVTPSDHRGMPSDQMDTPKPTKTRSRPRPQYTVGTPPVIEGGEIIATEDLEVDNGLETRKINAAPGSTRMSIMAGDSFDLPHLPGQETTYVGNGGWSTFVPWGLTTPGHVNAVLDHLLGEFTAPRQPTLTREERMARREEQKKGQDKGKHRN